MLYLVIPGGATPLLQPLDVTLNKPLKDSVRSKYFDWLKKETTQLRTYLMPPDLLKVIDWIIESSDSLEPPLIMKSFDNSGVTKRIEELFEENKLCQRLIETVDCYLQNIDIFPEDEEEHMDPKIEELREMCNNMELEIIRE